MLLPSIIRQTQYIEAPQLKRWICLYWMSAMGSIVVLIAILTFNEVHVMVDEQHKRNDDVAKVAIIAGALVCVFCGFMSKYDVMNPIGVVFVTILTLFIMLPLCAYGFVISGEGKSRNENAMYYINELKRVWDAEHRIPDWMTTTQRYIECCGVKSYKDYRVHIYGNRSGIPDFPQSCCAIRKWEWFYADPEPLNTHCNENIFTFGPSAIDNRSLYQKELEGIFYGPTVYVPLETSEINFNRLHFKGCENVLMEMTKDSFRATSTLLLLMGFWSLVLFTIHMVRFNNFMEKSVKVEYQEKQSDDGDDKQHEESSSAESFQGEINKRLDRARREARNSKTDFKLIENPDELTTMFPLQTSRLEDDNSDDSDSFDETDTVEMKVKRGTLKPRSRFEFLVSTINGNKNENSKKDTTENTDSRLDLSRTPSMFIGTASALKKTESTVTVLNEFYPGGLLKPDRHKEELKTMKEKIKEHRRHQLDIVKKEKELYDLSYADVTRSLGNLQVNQTTRYKYQGPIYSEKQRVALEKVISRQEKNAKKFSRKPSHKLP